MWCIKRHGMLEFLNRERDCAVQLHLWTYKKLNDKKRWSKWWLIDYSITSLEIILCRSVASPLCSVAWAETHSDTYWKECHCLEDIEPEEQCYISILMSDCLETGSRNQSNAITMRLTGPIIHGPFDLCRQVRVSGDHRDNRPELLYTNNLHLA